MHPGANQRWIKKAGVIRRENHRPLQRHALRIENAPAKVSRIEEPKKGPTKKINEIHIAARSREILLPLRRQVGERLGVRWCIGFGGRSVSLILSPTAF